MAPGSTLIGRWELLMLLPELECCLSSSPKAKSPLSLLTMKCVVPHFFYKICVFFPFLKLKITRLMRKIGFETNNSEAIYCCNQSFNKKSNPFHTHTQTHTHTHRHTQTHTHTHTHTQNTSRTQEPWSIPNKC